LLPDRGKGGGASGMTKNRTVWKPPTRPEKPAQALTSPCVDGGRVESLLKRKKTLARRGI